MTLNGIDVSNWDGLDYDTAGLDFVIVQAVDPPHPFPPTMTKAQAQATKDAGQALGYYLWLWNKGDFESDLRYKLSLIDQQPDMRLWLDVEDTTASFSQQRCLDALAILDEWCAAHNLPEAGIYTGHWYIKDYMGGWFPEGRKYWQADYGNPPHVSEAQPVHQYTSTPRDSDVMLESEVITVEPTDACQPYKDALEVGVNRLQIELDRKTAAGKPAAIRRAVLAEIAQGLYSALQQ